MIIMGMEDEISILFQWDTSLYLSVIQKNREDDSDLKCDELDDDGYDSEKDPILSPDSEFPIENCFDLREMLITSSEDAEEPFWIGRSTENVPKFATDLEVHWYELTARGKNPLRHSYVLWISYINLSPDPKGKKDMCGERHPYTLTSKSYQRDRVLLRYTDPKMALVPLRYSDSNRFELRGHQTLGTPVPDLQRSPRSSRLTLAPLLPDYSRRQILFP